MTFKHKLSVRLALLKDVRPLVPVLALLAACEQPMLAPAITTSINVSQIVTVPASITLAPGQNQWFASYGRTTDGDSVAVNVSWQAVGGGVMSANGLYTAATLQGDYAVIAKLIPPEGIGVPKTALPTQTSVVRVDPVVQIVVVPASASVMTGGTQQFAAYGRRVAGDSVGLSVVWSATGGTISSSGLYTVGATPGGYVVNASADGLSATATVTASSVPVASVVISPASVSMSAGSTQQLSAVATDAGGNVLAGRTVTWTTNSGAIATVTPSGLVSGVAVGSATITATSEGQSGTAAVSVTDLPVALVTVNPSPASVYVGASVQLGATLKDANGNPLSGRTVTWTTSDGAVAAVDGTGLVSGIALGTATITATSEGQTGTATVTVSSVPVASVVVAPSAANILVGATVQLTATAQDAAGGVLAGRAITWSSSNPSVATVSSSGLATGLAAGTTTISATSEGTNAAATVTVANVPVASVVITPATALMLAGASVQLVASPKDAGGSVLSGRAITWASSAPATATVSSSGVVTGVAAGAVTITATSEGATGSAAVTVNPIPVASLSLSPAAVSAAVGQAVQLTATPRDASGNPLTGRVVTWATSNAAVATVTASGQVAVGVVTGVAAGSATITATSEGKSTTSTVTVTLVPVASVAVTPAAATIVVGITRQLSAVTKDAAGNTLTGRGVTWASSNTSIATVSGSGLVTGQRAGSATITATSEGKNGTAAITVQGLPTGSHAGYYVAPNGSASGNGSATSPWDLRTALAQPAAVHPGDTIWLRGGTYVGTPRDINGAFVSRLTGTSSAPIIVRQYPGERATIDGMIRILGAWTYYWGFEVMFSGWTTRTSTSTGSSPTDMPAANMGVEIRGPNTKCINIVSHDLGGGFGMWVEAVGAEIYGSIAYNNGYTALDRGHGHGIYSQNSSSSRMYTTDNLLLNGYANGLQIYGTNTAADHYVVQGNVAFQNSGGANYSLGGIIPMTDLAFIENYSYAAPSNIGYLWSTGGSSGLVMRDNYLNGTVSLGNWAALQGTRNTFSLNTPNALLTTVVPAGASMAGYTLNNNAYYSPAGTPFSLTTGGLGGTNAALSLTGWRSQTGLDMNSTAQAAPSGVLVVVRPNVYEVGRGHVIVYNWSGVSAATADLSAVLQPGQRFEVRNAQNFYGPPVVSGTYAGGSVALPLTGLTAVAPIADASRPSRATSQFNAFVVLALP
jgi:uncharacterized protein YjdB